LSFKKRNSQNDYLGVHEDALEPAQFARREQGNFREVKAAQSGYQCHNPAKEQTLIIKPVKKTVGFFDDESVDKDAKQANDHGLGNDR
jgi:hypothetical protein